jgi:hypothetical protein
MSVPDAALREAPFVRAPPYPSFSGRCELRDAESLQADVAGTARLPGLGVAHLVQARRAGTETTLRSPKPRAEEARTTIRFRGARRRVLAADALRTGLSRRTARVATRRRSGRTLAPACRRVEDLCSRTRRDAGAGARADLGPRRTRTAKCCWVAEPTTALDMLAADRVILATPARCDRSGAARPH